MAIASMTDLDEFFSKRFAQLEALFAKEYGDLREVVLGDARKLRSQLEALQAENERLLEAPQGRVPLPGTMVPSLSVEDAESHNFTEGVCMTRESKDAGTGLERKQSKQKERCATSSSPSSPRRDCFVAAEGVEAKLQQPAPALLTSIVPFAAGEKSCCPAGRGEDSEEDEEEESESEGERPSSPMSLSHTLTNNRKSLNSMESVEPGMNFEVHERLSPHANWRRKSLLRMSRTQLMTDLFPDDNVAGLERFHDALERTCCFRLRSQPPGSMFGIARDVLGAVLICMDSILLPLQAFSDFLFLSYHIVDYITCFCWILDMIFTFITGYVDEHGRVEMQFGKIANRYVKTRFAFDFAMVLTDLVTIFISATAGNSRLSKALRLMRLLRLLRLLRLFEAAKSLERYLWLRSRSESFSTIFGISKVVLLILISTHFLACGWYSVGLASGSGSWIEDSQLDGSNVWACYITSFHWSVGQFSGDSIITPRSVLERTFAAISLLLAFITSAAIVSNLTTLMTRLQLLAAQHEQRMSVLQLYLKDNCVSLTLAARILDHAKFALMEQRRTLPETSVELLQHISQPLRIELSYEIRFGFLKHHPFFNGYNGSNPSGMRNVCHSALSWMPMSAGDVLFSCGEIQQDPKMYFITKGGLSYRRDEKEPRFIEQGARLNEAVLWTYWPRQVGAVIATKTSLLLCLSSKDFHTACCKFPTRHFHPALYAKLFVNMLNQQAKSVVSEIFDDFMDLDAIAGEVFGER